MDTSLDTVLKLKDGKFIDLSTTEFAGKISGILFSKGSFYLFKLKNDNGAEMTCCGNLRELNMQARYVLKGAFEYDKKFANWKFKFNSHEITIDKHAGMKELLIREAPFMGPVTAGVLADKFGDELLRIAAGEGFGVLAQHCKGMTEGKLKEFHAWAKMEIGNAVLKAKMYGIGLKPAEVRRLIFAFGENADVKIKRDVFKLIEIDGFGFKTTAKIADLLGVPQNDPGRIKCAIVSWLEDMQQHGHCCVQDSELVREVCGMCGGASKEEVTKQIEWLKEEGRLVDGDKDFEHWCGEVGNRLGDEDEENTFQ